jgi:DNA polymerase-3 subunit epsilon
MDFVAVDVETANADMASICQVGFVRYQNGSPVEEWHSLVDPEDDFDAINISIHGIDARSVANAPRLPDLADRIQTTLAGQISVCHTHFDRVAFTQAFERYRLSPLECRWLDSARVARRAWTQFAQSGYGLANLCSTFGFQYKAHDALEDARACAFVMLRAVQESGLTLEDWTRRVNQPIGGTSGSAAISRDGNPEGPLFGEIVVFTGALQIARREAADLAAKIGCEVDDSVTKKTTLLIVGDQDIKKLAGHEKSSKHRKAEKMISEGKVIRILRETDFRRLVELYERGRV